MHVDLTKKAQYPGPSSPMEQDRGLHLYLDDLCVLELPDEGCITFKYKKGPVTATEASDRSPAHASADLRLLEICDVKAEELKEEVEEELSEDTIDELFEAALASEATSEDEVE